MTRRSTSHSASNVFHAVVAGRVQGVGFRVFVREAAQKLGCRGWVRNLPDGRVELYAEADEMTLTELLTEVSKGPPWAHVDKVDIRWEMRDHGEERFRIVR